MLREILDILKTQKKIIEKQAEITANQQKVLENQAKILERLSQQLPSTFNNSFYMPKSEDWYWKPTALVNKTLRAGKKKVIWDEESTGWLYYVILTANSPYIEYNIDLHGDNVVEIRGSIYTSYAMGLTQNLGFRVLKYDTVNDIYTMSFSPGVLGFFGIPFRGRNAFWLSNPTDNDITYTFYSWHILLRE